VSEAAPSSTTSPPKRSRAEEFVAATKRLKWYWKVLILLGELTILEYSVDRFFFSGTEFRTLVACGTLGRLYLDYKLHYGPNCLMTRHSDEDLHQRNAKRLSWMMNHNGGLYLKAGQALAMQGSALPQEYQELFGKMFYDAPAMSWSKVRKIIEADFDGRDIKEIFGDGQLAVFEETPRAAASIAQVHFACLADGTEIAVKVQNKGVAKQIGWDLWVMKLVLGYTSWSSRLPMARVGEFMERLVKTELDFESEAKNSESLSQLIASDQPLKDRVHIPTVYAELSTKHVLTTEWIDGVNLWDKDTISGTFEGRQSSQGGSSGQSQTVGDVMGVVLELWSKQMFSWGMVHCDPSPGNIIVRQHPQEPTKPQIVLLDHGLYIPLSPLFREQYARFWKALYTGNRESLDGVTQEWGIIKPDAWVDGTLMRSFRATSKPARKIDVQKAVTDDSSGCLGDEDVFPPEVVLMERVISILQGDNEYLGVPVSCLNVLGRHALQAITENSAEPSDAENPKTETGLHRLDLSSWWTGARRYLGYGPKIGGEEDVTEIEEVQKRKSRDLIGELLGISVDQS
jgi:aarF domain-containing kinase